MADKPTYEELEQRIKELEETQAEYINKHQLVMQAIHDGVWENDFKNSFFKFSDKMFTMLGYDPIDGVEGYNFLISKLDSEDRKSLERQFEMIKQNQLDTWKITFRLRAADDSWCYILSRGNCIAKDENGVGYHYIGTHTDITDSKLTEIALRESEKRFKALHNASFGGIAIHNKGVILDCNQGLAEMTGYSLDELIGMDGLLLIAEQSRKMVMNNILSGYQKSYEAFGLRKNGEEFPIRLNAKNIPYKGMNVRVTEFRDLSDQKKMEAKLLIIEHSIDNITDSIFWVDKSGKIFFINSTACKNLGYSEDELLTMTVFDIDTLYTKEQWEKHLHKMGNLNSGIIETIHKRKDGSTIPVEVTVNLVRYGKEEYLCGVARDISLRKEAEAKQKELEATNQQLQKGESLRQMAGGIAHLFNNYLYVVLGNLELALGDLDSNSRVKKNITEATKAAKRCSDVSRTMLTYIGHNVVKCERVDLSKFCRANLSVFSSLFKNNITMETLLSDEEIIVFANQHQMELIVTNLIINASESIGGNQGRITFTTKLVSQSDISKLYLLPAGQKPLSNLYAGIEITDTGCGISTEHIYKLFDPFFTTKFTGRGLGLAVVLGILKSWGGMIGVKSKIGQGSSFMVILPLAVDNSTNKPKKSNQLFEINSQSTVLIVDDHQMVRNMAELMLKRIGFKVILAKNGVEAIKMFKQHKDSISCLITDLSMPELDGWGTLSEIRKINPDIPAILASGYDEAFAMSSNYSERPQAFLHKPYSMNDLKAALKQALKLENIVSNI